MGRLVTLVVSLALICGLLDAATAGHRGSPYRTMTGNSPLYRVAVVGDSYTAGSDEGGRGPNGWAALSWQTLADSGIQVDPDVAAEGGAGYGVRGNHGSLFKDLTARAVTPDDVLVVFFGSRNDQTADMKALGQLDRDAFALAHRLAPSAALLVIGPPWPTANPPALVLRIRDILAAQAKAAGAVFVDPLAQGWFVGRPELIGGDGVHPNDAGHAYLADKIAPLISARLPRRV